MKNYVFLNYKSYIIYKKQITICLKYTINCKLNVKLLN